MKDDKEVKVYFCVSLFLAALCLVLLLVAAYQTDELERANKQLEFTKQELGFTRENLKIYNELLDISNTNHGHLLKVAKANLEAFKACDDYVRRNGMHPFVP